jgi:hypothetical protein
MFSIISSSSGLPTLLLLLPLRTHSRSHSGSVSSLLSPLLLRREKTEVWVESSKEL